MNFHGVSVIVESNGVILAWLRHDYSYFLSDAGNDSGIKMVVLNETPDYSIIPEVNASIFHLDYIAYDHENTRYVDYYGQALCVFNKVSKNAMLYSKDVNLLYDILDLILDSVVGEELDKKRLHRIHCLGFTFKNANILCLLPMGGGKTTLALDLLKNPEVKLLSDDTPLISHKGRILSHPTRLGIRKDSFREHQIEKKFLRVFERMRFEPKVLINVEAFREKIASSGATGKTILLLGRRKWSNESVIRKVCRINATPVLFKNMVLGLELPQALAYFLMGSPKDYLSKLGLGLSRMTAALNLLIKSDTYFFTLGRDNERNAQTLMDFLDKEIAD